MMFHPGDLITGTENIERIFVQFPDNNSDFNAKNVFLVLGVKKHRHVGQPMVLHTICWFL